MKDQNKEWFGMDFEQLEQKPLSDLHKKRIKAHVLANNQLKNKSSHMRSLAAAALLGLSVVSASYFALPAIAGQIPFVQNVLSYFEDEELPASYTTLATVIDQSQASNGIHVMIENAVYDGTNVIITYAIQSDLSLGDNPRTEGWIDIKESIGTSGSGSIEKINESTYVGVEKVTPLFKEKKPEAIHVHWVPQAFINSQTEAKIQGDWQFEFTLTQLASNFVQLDETSKQDGITINMKSLERSDLAAVLDFEYFVEKSVIEDWPFVSIEMAEVIDNLGNVYELNGNGSINYEDGTFNQSKTTIYSLDEQATSLTVTPEIYYSKGSGEMLEIKKMSPLVIELK